MKVILRTLDKCIATAEIPINPHDNRTCVVFNGQVFRPSFDREYDPVYVEVPTVDVGIIEWPQTRPKPTSPYREVRQEYILRKDFKTE